MQIIRCRYCKEKACEKSPILVLEELKKIKNKENGQEIEFSRLNFEEIHVDLENKEEAEYLIEKNSEEAFYKNDKVFFIGGDHNITYSIGKSFEKVHDGLIIVFDSHLDSKEGDWLRRLVDGGFFGRNILFIGARHFREKELEFLKQNQITLIKMDLLQEDLSGICDLVMERAIASPGFYISIDIDVLDPGFAPGVANGEPGGLSSRELIYFIKRLSLLKNFKGADIVGINPEKDVNNMTIKLGAKLLSEMI